jgi:hypothetical protein
VVLLTVAAAGEAVASVTGEAGVMRQVRPAVAGTVVAGVPGWAVMMIGAAALATGLAGLLSGLRAVRRGWRPAPRLLLTAGCGVAVLLALLPSAGSTDVYSYAVYGHILATGHDPYLLTPSGLPHQDPYAALIPLTWPHMPSVYGPLATALFGLAAWLGGSSPAVAVLGLKLAAAAAFCATAIALDRVAARGPAGAPGPDEDAARQRRLRACLLWTLDPLVWQSGVAGAHADVFGAALVAAALMLWPRTRRSLAALAGTGALLAGAVLIKAPFALAVPGFVLAAAAGRQRWRRTVILMAAVAACCELGYALAGPGAVTAPLLRMTSAAPQLQATLRFAPLAVLCLVPVVAWVIARSQLATGPRCAVAGLALSAGWLATSTIQYPWYGLLAVPFLAVVAAGPLDWLLPLQSLLLTLPLLPGLPQPDGYASTGSALPRAAVATVVLALLATLAWRRRVAASPRHFRTVIVCKRTVASSGENTDVAQPIDDASEKRR